jgi:hypothetical protein
MENRYSPQASEKFTQIRLVITIRLTFLNELFKQNRFILCKVSLANLYAEAHINQKNLNNNSAIILRYFINEQSTQQKCHD